MRDQNDIFWYINYVPFIAPINIEYWKITNEEKCHELCNGMNICKKKKKKNSRKPNKMKIIIFDLVSLVITYVGVIKLWTPFGNLQKGHFRIV